MRSVILWGVLLLVLLTVNVQIVGKERLLASGTPVLLELAPKDPRSLLQGDYMSLRYRLADELLQVLEPQASADGEAVVRLDEHGVARLVRLHGHGETMKPDERLLFFRKRGDSLRLAGDAYFFQEGQAERFRDARYGALRVADDGTAILVGLRDGNFQRLGPSGD